MNDTRAFDDDLLLADNYPPQLLAQPSVHVSELADRLDVIFVEEIHDRSIIKWRCEELKPKSLSISALPIDRAAN